MIESRSRPAVPGLVQPLRIRAMTLALAQIGCSGVLVAQPVHATPVQSARGIGAAGEERVLYLAQASSDYSKLPGKRPPGPTNAPPPPPPTGMSGGGGSTGPGSQGVKPAPGTDGRVQKR